MAFFNKKEEVINVEQEESKNSGDKNDQNEELIKAKSTKLKGLTTTGQKIDLSKFDKPEVKKEDADNVKKKRKRIILFQQ